MAWLLCKFLSTMRMREVDMGKESGDGLLSISFHLDHKMQGELLLTRQSSDSAKNCGEDLVSSTGCNRSTQPRQL